MVSPIPDRSSPESSLEEGAVQVAPEGKALRSGRRSRLRLLLVLALAAVLVSEGILRIWFEETLKLEVYPQIYEQDPKLGYQYVPGVRSEINVPGIHKVVQINSHGFYGKEFDLVKPPGTFRIALVGSSNESGIWMQGEEDVATVLERLLRSSGKVVEVLNLSVDGSIRGLANLRMIPERVLDASPDMVLLNFRLPLIRGVVYRECYKGYVYEPGTSAMTSAAVSELRERMHAYVDGLEGRFLTRLYDLSYCVRAAHRLQLRSHWVERGDPLKLNSVLQDLKAHKQKRIRTAFPLREMTSEETRAAIERAERAVTASGARLTLFWYRQSEVEVSRIESDRLERLIGNMAIPYIVVEMPSSAVLVDPNDGHNNEEGHRVIAERLFAALADDVPH